jgi:hypothetical protein
MGQSGDVISQAREIGLDVASAGRRGLAGFPPGSLGIVGRVTTRIRCAGHSRSFLSAWMQLSMRLGPTLQLLPICLLHRSPVRADLETLENFAEWPSLALR